MWFASISDLRAGLEVRPWGRKDFQSTYIMIVVRLILPDHHHYHIDHHLYLQGLVLPKPLLVSVGACCVGGQEEGRQGQAMFSDHHHIFSSYVLKSSSYLHWDKHRLINVPWWHFDQSSELSSSYLHWKNTLWSNRHNGIFIKADKVKLCSLIINIYSVGQIPSDQLTMIVFWSVKGGKVKLHPLIVVLSSWGND